jgi:hypothetical protein
MIDVDDVILSVILHTISLINMKKYLSYRENSILTQMSLYCRVNIFFHAVEDICLCDFYFSFIYIYIDKIHFEELSFPTIAIPVIAINYSRKDILQLIALLSTHIPCSFPSSFFYLLHSQETRNSCSVFD